MKYEVICSGCGKTVVNDNAKTAPSYAAIAVVWKRGKQSDRHYCVECWGVMEKAVKPSDDKA